MKVADAEHFRHRLLQDVLAQATEQYWLRRAATLAAAGTERCTAMAQATCR